MLAEFHRLRPAGKKLQEMAIEIVNDTDIPITSTKIELHTGQPAHEVVTIA